MKIEDKERIAAAEVADRNFQNGQLSGGLLVLAAMTPPVLALGHRASVNSTVTIGYIAAEAAALAVAVIGAGMWRRRQLRQQRSVAQPSL